jgi:peptidyl-prolyl cis-trans isomerase D
MLSLVRKHADSWMIKAIIWLIAFAFVGTVFYSWGMGGSVESRGDVVAEVQGQEIRFGEYERTFNDLIDIYRQQFGSRFSQDMIVRLDLKNVALDGLIKNKLLLSEAKNQNIGVSDKELIDHIQKIPVFQRDKKFDRNVYMNFLRFRRLSPKEFEDAQRKNLTIEKLENLVKEQAKVSTSEVLEAYEREENKVKLDYISIPETHFKANEEPKEEEVQEYYNKNKSNFRVEEQTNFQFVKLAYKDYEGKVEIHEEDIDDYYKTNIGKYRVEEQFKASHILFRVPASNNSSNEEDDKKEDVNKTEAKEKANDILLKIQAGEDFAELAKVNSDDAGTKNRGGDLGTFPKGTMVKEFEKALLKLKPGEVSQPVLSPFGYHLIKLGERIESRVKTLDEVKESIEKDLKSRKARQRARRVLKHIYKEVEMDQDLARAAKAKEAEVDTTGLIARSNHDVPKIGIVAEFYNAAFTLAKDRVSEPVHTAEASYLIKIADVKEPYIPELEKVKEKVVEKVKADKHKKLTKENVDVFANQIKKNKDISKVADSLKFVVQHTPLFGIDDSIPGIGDLQELKEKAFSLADGEVAMVFARRAFYLFKVAETKKAQEPDQSNKERLYKARQQAKGEIFYANWYDRLNEKAQIQKFPEFL